MAIVGSVSPVLDYAEPPGRGPVMQFAASPWLLLPLILLLAAGLRWFQIGEQSFWLDEFLAVQNSTGRGHHHATFERGVVIDPAPAPTHLSEAPGFFAIWTSLENDSHPPLHFMVLNLWRQVFGQSDAVARSLSAVFSLLAIVLLFDVARMLHGRAVALWACLLMALAGPQIQYAQEARNYTMLLALTLGACDALVRIDLHGVNSRRVFAMGMCLLAMLLTHYLSIWAVAAIGLYAVLRCRGRELTIALATFTGVGLIFAATWGPYLIEQMSGFGRELSAAREESRDGLVIRSLHRLALLPLRYFTQPMKESVPIGSASAVMFLLPLLLIWKRRDLLLWCLLGGCVILAVFVSDLIRTAHALAYVRYTLVASAAAYALPAAMLWHMQGFFRHVVPMVLTIACIAAIAQPYSINKADSREFAQWLASRLDPNDVLIVHTLPGHDWQAGALYLALSHYEVVRCPVIFLEGPPSPQVRQIIRDADEIWMMSPTLSTPNEELLPGSEMVESQLFPWVGTVEKVIWSNAGR